MVTFVKPYTDLRGNYSAFQSFLFFLSFFWFFLFLFTFFLFFFSFCVWPVLLPTPYTWLRLFRRHRALRERGRNIYSQSEIVCVITALYPRPGLRSSVPVYVMYSTLR